MENQVQKQKQWVFGLVVFYWFALYLHIPVQAPHLSHLGCLPFVVGVIVAAYGLAQFILRIPLGIRCDRNGRLAPFLLMGATMIPVSALIRVVCADWPWGLFVSNLCSGVAAALWIAILTWIGGLFPAQQLQEAMAYACFANTVGMLSATLGCSILSTWLGFRALAGLEVLLGLIAVGFACMVVRQSRAGAGKAEGLDCKADSEQSVEDFALVHQAREAEIQAALWNRRLWSYSLLGFIQQGVILSAVLSFAPDRLQTLGASRFEIGFGVFLYWVVTAYVGSLAGKPFFVRKGARLWVPLGLVLAAVYCLALGWVQAVWQFWLLQLLGGCFGGMVTPFALSSALAEVGGRARTTGTGVFQGVLAGGMVVLPPLLGAALGALGPEAGFSALAALVLATAVFAFVLTRRPALSSDLG